MGISHSFPALDGAEARAGRARVPDLEVAGDAAGGALAGRVVFAGFGDASRGLRDVTQASVPVATAAASASAPRSQRRSVGPWPPA